MPSMLADIARAVSEADAMNGKSGSAIPTPKANASPVATRAAPRQRTFHEEVVATWKADASVRAEFLSLPSYAAWRENEHRKASGLSIAEIRAEIPDAAGYLAKLQAGGIYVSNDLKAAVGGYAATWRDSPDIRSEFGSFEVFASYMRAKDAGRTRITGR